MCRGLVEGLIMGDRTPQCVGGWWKDIYIVGGRTHECVGGQWKDICYEW